MDHSTLRHKNREWLDAWWPEAFKAGDRLELADGLHACKRVADIVPDSWSGIADCSNCQSAQLIDYIKRCRTDRIVIGNAGETNPFSRMAILGVVFTKFSPMVAATTRRCELILPSD